MESAGIITLISRKKIAEARRGLNPLPAVAQIGIGDGGVNTEGDIIIPTEYDTVLKHELIRRDYDSAIKVSDTTYRYRVDIKAGELTAKNVSEIALFDSNGDMLAVKSFHPYKIAEDMEIAFEMDDIF